MFLIEPMIALFDVTPPGVPETYSAIISWPWAISANQGFFDPPRQFPCCRISGASTK
jgi:hypothetical protein